MRWVQAYRHAEQAALWEATWHLALVWHWCESGENKPEPTPQQGSASRRRRLAARTRNKSGAQIGVQAGCRVHVGIDQAGVDVTLGLDHHGVGCRSNSIGRFVALVRQRQAIGWPRWSLAASRRGGSLPSDRTAWSRVQRHVASTCSTAACRPDRQKALSGCAIDTIPRVAHRMPRAVPAQRG